MKNLDVNDFRKGFENNSNAVIIDVRTPEEEVEGLIPDSVTINIMEPNFSAKIMELDKTKTYYVYCRSGRRSATACQFMEKQGLTAFNLIGGIQSWNQSQG